MKVFFWEDALENGKKRIREKNLPELPNLTAYEDYNTIERHVAPHIRNCTNVV